MFTDRQQLIAEIPHLRRYARALLRDADAADELVQACLERALGRFHLWHTGRKLRVWLFTIMHNLHIDMIRHRKVRGDTIALDDIAQATRQPDQEQRLAANRVLAALDRLPDEQRDVLLLVGVNQLSYAEAARVLAIPQGTLMSRLHRGREALRRSLGLDTHQPVLRQVL